MGSRLCQHLLVAQGLKYKKSVDFVRMGGHMKGTFLSPTSAAGEGVSNGTGASTDLGPFMNAPTCEQGIGTLQGKLVYLGYGLCS